MAAAAAAQEVDGEKMDVDGGAGAVMKGEDKVVECDASGDAGWWGWRRWEGKEEKGEKMKAGQREKCEVNICERLLN